MRSTAAPRAGRPARGVSTGSRPPGWTPSPAARAQEAAPAARTASACPTRSGSAAPWDGSPAGRSLSPLRRPMSGPGRTCPRPWPPRCRRRWRRSPPNSARPDAAAAGSAGVPPGRWRRRHVRPPAWRTQGRSARGAGASGTGEGRAAALTPGQLVIVVPFPFIVWGANELRRLIQQRPELRRLAAPVRLIPGRQGRQPGPRPGLTRPAAQRLTAPRAAAVRNRASGPRRRPRRRRAAPPRQSGGPARHCPAARPGSRRRCPR